MFDDHLWLSVARRPQKSNFSRVQRWSMCLSTLYLTMVVNAMWYVYNYCGSSYIAFNFYIVSVEMHKTIDILPLPFKAEYIFRFPTSDEAREDTGASVQLGPINLSWRTFFVAIMGQ